ncbi:unnamed protein product (macronuclear) [Paramecium tetraurelia]|uniref:FHA domain-containing protein n=1 Tax=Paramecium tetraurelia TaxID=5888 RepID=A0DYF4_PARTE|nr:uncharacterized protein GSPATT00003039001 [Paramecium tetraurelia]CAK88071.1 unnamed protein product [Paramecium tetraurelia]|eukprot:XP_001455468.1 hypothetical protein (macronuclear) [Paramecium tetraurelia strain d4-2]
MGNCQCRKYFDSDQGSYNNNHQEIIINDEFHNNSKEDFAKELFIKIKTWQQESFSLFDYESQTHLKEQNIEIRQGGYLIKNNNEVQWIDDDIDWNKCVIKQHQILFRVEKINGVFTIINKRGECKQNLEDDKQELTTKYLGEGNRDFQQSENLDQLEGEEFQQSQDWINKIDQHNYKLNQSQRTNTKLLEKGSRLWLVVRSIQSMFSNSGIKLKQGDVIKLGRVKLKIREIQLNQRKQICDLDSSRSSQSDAISCRVCCSSQDSVQNPLINPCKCTGSIKYIHLNCLKKWLKLKFQTKHSNHCMIYMWKNLECEICKFNYPPVFKSDQHIVDLVELSKPTEQAYVLMEIIQKRQDMRVDKTNQDSSWAQCNGVYIVTFDNNSDDKVAKTKELQIGRANETEIRINDISVSRNHGTLKLNEGEVYLTDNKSKFGSLILMQQKVIPLINELNGIEIQVGRSVLQFNFGKDEQRTPPSKQCLNSNLFDKIIGRDLEDEDLLYN